MNNLDVYINTKFNPKRPSGFILALKRNKNNMLNELISNTDFLIKYFDNPTIKHRLYHYITKDDIQFCLYCDNVCMTNYQKITGPFYGKTCCDEKCRKKYVVDQTKAGIKKKYGVENISQTAIWKDKVKETNLKRRGVEWNTQSENFIKARKESWVENKDTIITKRVETTKQKYGVDHNLQRKEIRDANIKNYKDNKKVIEEKKRQTNLEKYGVEHVFQSENLKEKSKNFYKEKYDVEHNSQISSVLNKRFKYKDYILPSGRIVKIQGYENLALEELLKIYEESDIIIDNVEIEKFIGKILYITPEGKQHRYFPDLFIKSKNLIIEVKSEYTYESNKEINLLKREACLDNGFSFDFMIF